MTRVNPALPATGSARSGTRNWGGVCLSSKITEVFLEAYPKARSGVTDKSRYGYLTHAGHRIDLKLITRVRAFTNSPGRQCGAATQAYTLFVDCKCGPSGAVITRSRVVNIARRAGIRVDIGF